MSKVSCMIVEDEPVSQELLRKYIADLSQLELVAVCNNAIEAGVSFEKLKWTCCSSISTCRSFRGLTFTRHSSIHRRLFLQTAYPEFAVSGFDLNAIDYLVKPFPFERFVKAVGKFLDQRKQPSFIVLQADKKTYKVELDRIEIIEGYGRLR
ncbi:MAG: hypothetical protein WDO15_27965 [Bacteroidota bacterium]